MPLPCHKCGATKTEPVRRGAVAALLRAMGYRLRRCSRCRRRRVLRESVFQPRAAYAPNAARNSMPGAVDYSSFDPDGFEGCPRCGRADDYERTPRNLLERGLGWAPMARCRSCGKRFTYPQH